MSQDGVPKVGRMGCEKWVRGQKGVRGTALDAMRVEWGRVEPGLGRGRGDDGRDARDLGFPRTDLEVRPQRVGDAVRDELLERGVGDPPDDLADQVPLVAGVVARGGARLPPRPLLRQALGGEADVPAPSVEAVGPEVEEAGPGLEDAGRGLEDTGTEPDVIDVPDVDAIPFERKILKSRRFKSPIPAGRRRTTLYMKVRDRAFEYRKYRTLRETAAVAFLRADPKMDPTYELLVPRFHYLYVVLNDDTDAVAKLLRDVTNRDALIQRVDKRIKGSSTEYQKRLQRKKHLSDMYAWLHYWAQLVVYEQAKK